MSRDSFTRGCIFCGLFAPVIVVSVARSLPRMLNNSCGVIFFGQRTIKDYPQVSQGVLSLDCLVPNRHVRHDSIDNMIV